MLQHHHKENIFRAVANDNSDEQAQSEQVDQLFPPKLKFDTDDESLQSSKNEVVQTNQTTELNDNISPLQLKQNAENTSIKEKDESEQGGASTLSFDNSSDPPEVDSVSHLDETDANEQTPTASILPPDILQKMNAAFETDFSSIRIHTNSIKADNLGAKAYTVGKDIYFASGQYQPYNREGQELIGHELMHTIQQDKGKVKVTKQVKNQMINDDESLEKEADDMGAKAAQFKLPTASPANLDQSSSTATESPQNPFQLKSYKNDIGTLDTSVAQKKDKPNPWWKPSPTSGSDLATELNKYFEKSNDGFYKGNFYSNTSINGSSDSKIVYLLKTTSFANIQFARRSIEATYKKRLETLLIKKMGGSHITTSMIEAIYLINNKEKKGFHLELALLLLTKEKINKNEILRKIGEFGQQQGLKERKAIKLAYNKTFLGNLSKRGLSTDLENNLTHDARKKALALFHHDLTPADHLLHHISSDMDAKAAATIFTSAMQNGFAGIEQLEMDWNNYVRQYIGGSKGAFLDKPLFEATRDALGKNSQAWKTIKPIQTGYLKWKINPVVTSIANFIKGGEESIDGAEKSQDIFESEVLVEMALKVIEEAALGSKYGDKSNFGIVALDDIANAYEDISIRKSFKNYNDQIDWAISTFKTHMPKLIRQSKGIERKVLVAKWVYHKMQIESILDKSFKGKKSTKSKLNLNAPDQPSDTLVDNFYSAVIAKNKKYALAQAENIWAKDQVHLLHQGLTETERKDTLGTIVRPRIIFVEAFLQQNLGKKYAKRIYPLIDIHNSPEGRGFRRLSYEIMEKKPDLNIINNLVTNPNLQRSVLDGAIALFVSKYAVVLSLLKTSDRQAFLEVIKYRKFSKVVIKNGKLENEVSATSVEFDVLEKFIDCDVSNDVKIERLKKIGKKQGLNKHSVLGASAHVQIERAEQVNEDGVSEILSEQSGITDQNKFIEAQSEELIKTLDTIKRELEAEAAFASFVVEMVAFGAIAILSGGSASGLLVAAIASKAAGMGAVKAVKGENYELFSEENFKTLSVTAITELATMGVGSKFQALKKTQAFGKLGNAGKYAYAIGEQTANQVISKGIESAIYKRLPEWDEEVLNFVVESIAASFKVNLKGIEDEKRMLRNTIVDLVIHETPKEVGKAVMLASIRGEELDTAELTKTLIETVTKKLSEVIGKTWKGNAQSNEPPPDEKERSDQKSKQTNEQITDLEKHQGDFDGHDKDATQHDVFPANIDDEKTNSKPKSIGSSSSNPDEMSTTKETGDKAPLQTVGKLDRSKPMSSGGFAGASASRKGFGVFRHKIVLPSGAEKEVAIKVLPLTGQGSKGGKNIGTEMEGGQIAFETGHGPQVYGMVDIGDPNAVAFAMDLVEGDFHFNFEKQDHPDFKEKEQIKDATIDRINEETYDSLQDLADKILERGYYFSGEVQGLINDNGQYRPIDFASIKKLPEENREMHIKEHYANLEQELKNLKDAKSQRSAEKNKHGDNKSVSAHSENNDSTQKDSSPLHESALDLIKSTDDWDATLQALDDMSENRSEMRAALEQIREDLVAEVALLGGFPLSDASTLLESDIDFNFPGPIAGEKLLKAIKSLKDNHGPNFKRRFKIDLFVSKERLLKADQPRTHDEAVSHAETAEKYELAKMLSKLTPDDPEYERVVKMIEARTDSDKIYALRDSRSTDLVSLLTKSDNLESELQELIAESASKEEIKAKRDEISDHSMKLNAHLEDAYISLGAVGGTNDFPKVKAQEVILSQITMITKLANSQGGLEFTVRSYEVYKYLYRALSELAKSGENMTETQELMLNISSNVYKGDPEANNSQDAKPDRKMYEEYPSDRESGQFTAVLRQVISDLYDSHAKLKEGNKSKTDEGKTPEKIEK